MASEGKKEPEEQKTLRELIQESGTVFDNPIMVAIIEAGRSPKSVDNHILKELGWPNKAAEKARNAARIKEQFPKLWPEIKRSKARPMNIFIYTSENVPFPPEMGIHKSVALLFDECTALRKKWPVLLNEFMFKEKDGTFISTFDEDGQFGSFLLLPYDVKTSDMFDFDGDLLYKRFSPKHGLFIHNGFYHITSASGQKDIYGKTVMVQGEPHDTTIFPSFPSFFKALEIEENAQEKTGYDRIRIIMKMNLGPATDKTRDIGKMIFERIIPVSQKASMVLTMNYYLVEELENRISWRRFLRAGNAEPFGLKLDDATRDPDWRELNKNRVSQASVELTKLTERLFNRTSGDLDNIAGTPILTRPPARLADLLIEKE